MTIIRQFERKRYSSISNILAQDTNLSLRSKGLMLYLLSLPDDWEVHVSHLTKIFKEGRNVMLKILKELINAGYVHRAKDGFQSKMKYFVFEEAISTEEFQKIFTNSLKSKQFRNGTLQKTNTKLKTNLSNSHIDKRTVIQRHAHENPPPALQKSSPQIAAVAVSLSSSKKKEITQEDRVKALSEKEKKFHDVATTQAPKGHKPLESHYVTREIRKYGIDRVIEAWNYGFEFSKKNQIKSWGGFFRKCLENGWKIPSEKEKKCKAYAMKMAERHLKLEVLEKYVRIEQIGWDMYYSNLPSFEEWKRALDQKLSYIEGDSDE